MVQKKEGNRKKQVEVDLLGETYSFKGESKTQIKEAAEIVDSHLWDVKERYPHLGKNRLMILALMELGNEFIRLKKENEELLDFFAREE